MLFVDGGLHAVLLSIVILFFFFFQAEDGIRDDLVTGVQTCALPISISYLRRCLIGLVMVGYFSGSAE